MSTITNEQGSIIQNLDSVVEDGFLNGVITSPGNTTICNPITNYSTLTASQRIPVRQIFESSLAALIKQLGIGSATNTGTITVTYVKTVNFVGQSVTTGTLTFVDGILTSST